MAILKNQTIHSFFKRKTSDGTDDENQEAKRSKASTSKQPQNQPEEHEQPQNQPEENEQPQNEPDEHVPIYNTPSPNASSVDLNSLERDPGKRTQIWNYSPNQKELIRRSYLNLRPFQIDLKEYPVNGSKKHPRRFQSSWFNLFPSWLEYSPTTNSAYCFLCYLFSDKPNVKHGSDAFTVKGFNNWKKVNDGKNCAFLKHIGCSQHRAAVAFSENLLNQDAHIESIIQKQNAELIFNNRVRLKASIDIVRWLTFQACAFRGHDETRKSKNRSNFIEMLKLLASYNVELANVVLENAPFNSKYTSGDIQKEILNIIANKVRKHIRSEVGDSYFCVMVDEARDESKKEQMAIVLRFVDNEGVIRERFLDLVHVNDTSSVTLKKNLWKQLVKHKFDTSKIRGQGYDGASNMRGEWNGLQALVVKDCPYAYYIHCFAHRLQLALVAAASEVIPVHQFFTKLSSIINVICASSKRHDELLKARSTEIESLLKLGEIKCGRGKNQVGTLKRASDTRWGSHLYSVENLLRMFNLTRVVLESVIRDGYYSQRADADAAYTCLKSFEFVFILHLMKEIMGRTDILSQALQKKNQDIGNAIDLVSATKESLNDFRNNGWDCFREKVMIFSKKHQIDIPDMNALYKSSRYRPRQTDNHFTFEHYYRAEVFISILDKQLHELNNRFSDHAMELLTLGSALVPRNDSNGYNIDEICLLVEKYYPADFTEQERLRLSSELQIFNIERSNNLKLSKVSTIAELCKVLVETKKRDSYYLLDRLIRLILTFPVSTATAERGFSAMKICKSRLRNRMSDDFLADSLVVYIEKEVAENFDSESLIDEFKKLKGRRADL